MTGAPDAPVLFVRDNGVGFMHRGKVWEEGPAAMLDAPHTEELRQFLGNGF